ncbi:uncharacterized protein LOC121738284 [Aricia agestis]|uniref:uncharacterized protein LOC121738284 n=1 Tax=Aricia agestis TaxID=91739 RepID=UPI001C20B000|nr:uncharacterized protein LOC121738284 [Aricia agestis]
MTYIVVTESESTEEITCKIKGSTSGTIKYLENHFSSLNLPYHSHKEYFEVDVEGVLILNALNSQGYKVITQSMAIEYTTVGGRSFKVQKLVWTLGKFV